MGITSTDTARSGPWLCHDVTVKFAVEQKYEAPPEDVLAAYADPTTWEQLGPFSRVNIVEVLDSAGTPERPVLRIRYRFIADLPSAARAVVDPAKLTWVEETTYDLQNRTSTMRFQPDFYGSKLSASASTTFSGADNTQRRVQGDLRVKVLLVGGQVEGAIVSGLKDYLVEEQAAFSAILNGTGNN